MLAFVIVTATLFLGLSFVSAYFKRSEIMANWSKYRNDPLYMFAAPMFKPDDDPRSRLQFAADNFRDVLLEMLTKIFMVFLQPVFEIFRSITNMMNESLNGLFNIRSLIGNMWNKFEQMLEIFFRRFYGVFNNFRVTFAKLFNAFQKVYGVAISSIYSGLSFVHLLTSFIDLMITVVIVILSILVVMVILLFFVLFPFIPLILVAIGIIAGTAFGGAVGGMAGAFCLDGSAPVELADGRTVPIRDITLNTVLRDGGVVKSIMKFKTQDQGLFELQGVCVSGDHIVYEDGKAVYVKDHPHAVPRPSNGEEVELYCLITSTRRIPVRTERGILVFADWEELDDDDAEALEQWHEFVHAILNPTAPYKKPDGTVYASESGCSGGVKVAMPNGGFLNIREVDPGMVVCDASGAPTRVTGKIVHDGSQVKHAVRTQNGYISSATWMKFDERGAWMQPPASSVESEKVWYMLCTEAGTFQIVDSAGRIAVRDFTDVGPDRIRESYSMILSQLNTAENLTM